MFKFLKKKIISIVEKEYSTIGDGYILPPIKGLKKRLEEIDKDMKENSIKIRKLKILYLSTLTQEQFFSMFKYVKYSELAQDERDMFNKLFKCGRGSCRYGLVDVSDLIIEAVTKFGLYKEGVFTPDTNSISTEEGEA